MYVELIWFTEPVACWLRAEGVRDIFFFTISS